MSRFSENSLIMDETVNDNERLLTNKVEQLEMSNLGKEQNQLLIRQKSQQFVEEINFEEIQTEEVRKFHLFNLNINLIF